MQNENPLLHLRRDDLPGRFNEARMLLDQQARLEAINSGKIVPPYEVIIHPSGVCNLGCEWCIGARILDGSKTAKSTDRLKSRLTNPKVMEKVITDMLAYEREGFRIQNFSFSGITGEPMVAKKAFMGAVDLLKADKERNVRVGVFSNSALIDDDLIQTLLKMDYINVSLDAATPETFAKLKYAGLEAGKGMYDRIIANITKLAKARDESGSKLAINASMILHPDNFHELYDAAVLLKAIGVDALRMKQDISGGRLLSPAQLQQASELVEKTEAIQGDDFKFIQIHHLDKPPVTKRQFQNCRVTDLWGAVGSDGSVFPCNYNALVGVEPYGNVIEQSFAEVWEGEKRLEMKKKLPEGCPPMCDPFKTRANLMLELAAKAREEFGAEKANQFIEELVTGKIS